MMWQQIEAAGWTAQIQQNTAKQMKQCVTSQCKQVMTPKAKRPVKATQEFLRTENEQTFQLKKKQKHLRVWKWVAVYKNSHFSTTVCAKFMQLKLKVCTLITFWLLDLKSTVCVCPTCHGPNCIDAYYLFGRHKKSLKMHSLCLLCHGPGSSTQFLSFVFLLFTSFKV